MMNLYRQSPIIVNFWLKNRGWILTELNGSAGLIRSRSHRVQIPIDTVGGFWSSMLTYDFRTQFFYLDGTLVQQGWDDYGK